MDYEQDADIQKVFLSSQAILNRVLELGSLISSDYRGKMPILVGALKGVVCFMADLIRAISIPVKVDFIAISSYSPEERDRGVVRVVKDLDRPITGRHVIFIEDVIDTGLTTNYLVASFQARQPASLEVCTLFNKTTHRLIDLSIKYKGFDLPDYFVVGYGLDHQEKYRNLPYVGILKPEILFQRRKNKSPGF